ncbi:hypothetical protein ACWV26_17745 [Rummeliibacillus sp. JY-2-4R]
MEVTLEIRTFDSQKREVTVTSEEGITRQVYTGTNAIYPLYKELIYFCRGHGSTELDVCSNSASFISDLKNLETSGKRLAVMLKDTLADSACSIKSIKYITR